MSAETPLAVRSWRVGKYTVEMTVPRPEPGRPSAVAMEWAPHMPERLTTSEIAQYRRGRDAALAELAEILGGNVAVIEA